MNGTGEHPHSQAHFLTLQRTGMAHVASPNVPAIRHLTKSLALSLVNPNAISGGMSSPQLLSILTGDTNFLVSGWLIQLSYEGPCTIQMNIPWILLKTEVSKQETQAVVLTKEFLRNFIRSSCTCRFGYDWCNHKIAVLEAFIDKDAPDPGHGSTIIHQNKLADSAKDLERQKLDTTLQGTSNTVPLTSSQLSTNQNQRNTNQIIPAVSGTNPKRQKLDTTLQGTSNAAPTPSKLSTNQNQNQSKTSQVIPVVSGTNLAEKVKVDRGSDPELAPGSVTFPDDESNPEEPDWEDPPSIGGIPVTGQRLKEGKRATRCSDCDYSKWGPGDIKYILEEWEVNLGSRRHLCPICAIKRGLPVEYFHRNMYDERRCPKVGGNLSNESIQKGEHCGDNSDRSDPDSEREESDSELESLAASPTKLRISNLTKTLVESLWERRTPGAAVPPLQLISISTCDVNDVKSVHLEWAQPFEIDLIIPRSLLKLRGAKQNNGDQAVALTRNVLEEKMKFTCTCFTMYDWCKHRIQILRGLVDEDAPEPPKRAYPKKWRNPPSILGIPVKGQKLKSGMGAGSCDDCRFSNWGPGDIKYLFHGWQVNRRGMKEHICPICAIKRGLPVEFFYRNKSDQRECPRAHGETTKDKHPFRRPKGIPLFPPKEPIQRDSPKAPCQHCGEESEVKTKKGTLTAKQIIQVEDECGNVFNLCGKCWQEYDNRPSEEPILRESPKAPCQHCGEACEVKAEKGTLTAKQIIQVEDERGNVFDRCGKCWQEYDNLHNMFKS